MTLLTHPLGKVGSRDELPRDQLVRNVGAVILERFFANR
jgi:hypothetical protein